MLLLSLLIGRTLADELCGRTDGSAVRDAATGSVLMAGAVVVGMTASRDGTVFATSPTDCDPPSESAEAFPDCDKDGMVTLVDYQCLYECLAGPRVRADERCVGFDFDQSGAVDVKDARVFQNRFGTSIGR
jgi:hypothetical protein